MFLFYVAILKVFIIIYIFKYSTCIIISVWKYKLYLNFIYTLNCYISMCTEVEVYMKQGDLKFSNLPLMSVCHATMEHVQEYFKVFICLKQHLLIYFEMVSIEYSFFLH